MDLKIPKIIHYVWFGRGQKNELIKKCIASWREFCPDYQIIEWNEDTFDIEEHSWVKLAVKNRNWALAADIIRLWSVYNYGGVYLDTDVELVSTLDNFLQHEFFIGYESKHWLNPATFGAIKGHEIIKKCLMRYDKECTKIDFSTNPLTVHTYGVVLKILYNIKMNGKLKILDNNVAIYPVEYLCPMNYTTHILKTTQNTCAIHHYTNTWLSASQTRGVKFARFSRRILGGGIYSFFEKIVAIRFAKMIKKNYKKIDKEAKIQLELENK